MGSDEKLLERAAAANGIELEYTDVFGKVHRATEGVTRALLEALGVPASTDAEIERSLEGRRAEEWSRAIDPVIVVREDAGAIRLRVPAAIAGASVKLEIEWENGEIRHDWYWLSEVEQAEAANAAGADYVAKRLPLPALRLGYHRMRVYRMLESGLGTLAEARLVVCPKRAKSVDRRRAGFGVSLYGVRSARNWGCGDFTDLHAIIDAFAPAGAAFIGLNPLHAIANRQPFNTSPYLPECSSYRNFIYLDVERVAEFEWGDDLRREIEALRATEFVEYERVAAYKLGVLKALFHAAFLENGSAEFDRYVASEGQPLDDYAVYCVLSEEMHARDPNVWLWTQWPNAYQDPRSEAVREFARAHRDQVTFHKFIQWHVARQAAGVQEYARAKGMEIGMYHDLALATDRFGCDLWAQRSFYSTGCRVGAPPDDLAPQGQDWGFPPPNRDQHRDDGYRMFAQSIRQAAAAGGALRIDHVMRFFRLFWIPEAFPASQGTYVKDYADDLLGILALESVRGDFAVVGEDLGTVTGEVREALGAAGILGYRLLWFEKDGAGNFKPPDQYPRQALASATTHDLPTLAGFRLARDIEARKAAGLIDDSEYHTQKAARQGEIRKLDAALENAGFAGDPLGFLLATPCLLAMVNYEDLSGELEQQNLPGSTWQHPNWRRKWKGSVEEIGPLAERFRELVERSGRTGRH